MLPSKDEIVKQVQQTIESKDWNKQAIKVLKKSSDAVLDRAQQNIAAQLQEDTAPIVENFVVNLSKTLMDATVNFLKAQNDVTNTLPVFPQGTRYIKQNGNFLDVVIEQQPQVRTVSFTPPAAACFDKEFRPNPSYHLAIPYTIFVLTFSNGVWSGNIQAYWRSKPLNSLNDELALMPFPNISGSGSVCMGDFRLSDYSASVSIDKQCQEIISAFWQSRFSTDHIERFTKFLNLNGFMDNESHCVHKWVDKSHENPLLGTSLKLQPANVKLNNTFGPEENHNLIASLKQHILTAVGQIGGEVQKLLVDLDVKSENKDKVHVETMSTVIKEIIVQAYAELWDQLSIKLDKERKADSEKNRKIKEEMKKEFLDWVAKSYKST